MSADLPAAATVFVVDDDEAVRDALKMLLHACELQVETFASADAFLSEYRQPRPGCLVLDIRMPGISGLELQDELRKRRIQLPIVFLTGHGDVPLAVRAIKRGAVDFILKPHDEHRLVLAVMNALKTDTDQRLSARRHVNRSGLSTDRVSSLSDREHEVLNCVLDGMQTRDIAAELRISIKTVEFHRAHIREKLGVSSLAELFKLFHTRSGASSE